MSNKEWQEFSAACPVCESDSSALQRKGDYGNIAFFCCAHCGPFKIDHMAYFEVKTKFVGEVRGPIGRRRLYNLIKNRQEAEACPEINRDEVLAIADDSTLPGAFKQIVPENRLPI